jgi:hypothetical protein
MMWRDRPVPKNLDLARMRRTSPRRQRRSIRQLLRQVMPRFGTQRLSWLDTSLEDALSGQHATPQITRRGRQWAGDPARHETATREGAPRRTIPRGTAQPTHRPLADCVCDGNTASRDGVPRSTPSHGATGALIPLPTLAIIAPIRSLDLSGSALHRVVFAGERRAWWRTYARQGCRVHLPDGTSRAWAEHYADLFGAEHAQALRDLVHEMPPVGRSEGTA